MSVERNNVVKACCRVLNQVVLSIFTECRHSRTRKAHRTAITTKNNVNFAWLIGRTGTFKRNLCATAVATNQWNLKLGFVSPLQLEGHTSNPNN